MEWSNLYDQDSQPVPEQVSEFIDTPLWWDMNDFLEETYHVPSQMSYSGCSAQPGWNVKYKKSGKSLCTLYPMPGFFIALVVIGQKETHETELQLPLYSEYTRALYEKTPFSLGGRWLMINVTDEEILSDVKNLIGIRVKPRK